MGKPKPLYKQCKLRQGVSHLVCWLPVVFAKKGKYLQIDAYDGLWKVESVGEVTISESTYHSFPSLNA